MSANDYVDTLEPNWLFEFKAHIHKAGHFSWTKVYENKAGTKKERTFTCNKYAFSSDKFNGTLLEWTEAQPTIQKGECSIRFDKLSPSRDSFGCYDVSGFIVTK